MHEGAAEVVTASSFAVQAQVVQQMKHRGLESAPLPCMNEGFPVQTQVKSDVQYSILGYKSFFDLTAQRPGARHVPDQHESVAGCMGDQRLSIALSDLASWLHP